jgi:hypothetical protein
VVEIWDGNSNFDSKSVVFDHTGRLSEFQCYSFFKIVDTLYCFIGKESYYVLDEGRTFLLVLRKYLHYVYSCSERLNCTTFTKLFLYRNILSKYNLFTLLVTLEI